MFIHVPLIFIPVMLIVVKALLVTSRLKYCVLRLRLNVACSVIVGRVNCSDVSNPSEVRILTATSSPLNSAQSSVQLNVCVSPMPKAPSVGAVWLIFMVLVPWVNVTLDKVTA